MVVRFQGSATFADNVEIVLADGARLTYVTLQDWADDAVHHSTQRAVVGRDASLKHVAVTFGGSVVRHDVTATYDGPGGEVEMLGLYFADAGQHIEHRLFVDHNAPKTRSRVTYKGALQGQGAHTVWIGNVLIRKEAEGIDTYEENRNLVLTDGCQADSVPNLEIETGEIVGAGHASATGRFDDEQLFYLRSRGIEEKEARRLVVHGFFNDLIRRIARARARGAAGRHGRGRAVQERAEGRLMAFVRACALADIKDDAALGGHRRRPGRRARPPRRGGLRHRGHVQPRQRRAERGRLRDQRRDCTVECWLHGSRFDLRTGKPTGLPATEPVATFPVDVRRRRCLRRHRDHPERSHPQMSTLEIKDLHVTVETEDGAKEILKGVTLTVNDGETHAIMGPNGSGKSTLAYSVAGHPKYTDHARHRHPRRRGRAGDDRRRAGAGRAVPGHAVPRRGARRLGVQLPAHRQDGDRRRGAQAAHLGQGRQRDARRPQPRPDVRPALGQRGLLRR